MRRALLAGAACLCFALADQAQAQRVVHDPVHMAETIARGVNEVRQLERQYRQLVTTYEAITGARSLGGLANGLGGMSRTFMPRSTSVPGMMHGTGGTYGQGQAMLDRNRVYAPAERDEWAMEMERRETVTANAQALAAAGLEDAEDRIVRLEDLRGSLEQAQDTREVEGINGAIAIEQQNLAAHRAQLEQVRLLLATEGESTAKIVLALSRASLRSSAGRKNCVRLCCGSRWKYSSVPPVIPTSSRSTRLCARRRPRIW